MARTLRPRVFVTRQLPGEALERLRRHVELQVWEGALPPSREQLLEATRAVDGLITLLTDRVGAGLLARSPSLRVDSPLLKRPDVLLAPHIASASHATRGRMASMAVDNLLAGLDGRRPPHCVNPEIYE